MGLIRFLFFIVVVGVAWFMVKNYLRKQEVRARRRATEAQIAAGKDGRIVRCKHCDLHLPESQALREGDDWFCSQAHRQAAHAGSGRS